jgi:hypothetical protein
LESFPGAVAAAAAANLASAQPKTTRGRREEGIVQCSQLLLCLQTPPENNTKGKEIPNSSEILGYLLPW